MNRAGKHRPPPPRPRASTADSPFRPPPNGPMKTVSVSAARAPSTMTFTAFVGLFARRKRREKYVFAF